MGAFVVSIQDSFGVLRSLMQQDLLTKSQREQLFILMRNAWLDDPELYRCQWVTYLSHFAHHFIEPLAVLSDVKALEQASAFAPFACFSANWGYKSMGDEDALTMAQSPLMSQLTSLDLSGNSIGAAGAAAFTESPYTNDEN